LPIKHVPEKLIGISEGRAKNVKKAVDIFNCPLPFNYSTYETNPNVK
jgi:hypothetical protein